MSEHPTDYATDAPVEDNEQKPMEEDAQGSYTKKAIVGICGMLSFGTGTMVSSKIMLDMSACPTAPVMPDGSAMYEHGQCEAYGVDKKKFEKPWFQTGAMFTAMSMCILMHIGVQISNKRKQALEDHERMLAGGEETSAVSNIDPNGGWLQKVAYTNPALANMFIGVPSVFDMIATTLMTMGLIYIDVSVMQMLRGSMVIFSAIFCVFFLKRKIRPWMWASVALTATACALVGVSCIEASKNDVAAASMAEQLYGCMLVVLSQFVQAGQIVCEDFLLSRIDAVPLQVVGMEGVWGSVVTCLIMWPIMYYIPGSDTGHGTGATADGCVENIFDSFYMMADNGQIIGWTICYWICILFLNWSGMVVTDELTSVHRTIFEALRTAAIWVTDLAINYVFAPHSVYGESWTSWSWIQLAGFLLLIFSTQVYNGIVKYNKLFDYDSAVKAEEKSLLDN
ncbi:hypothetical protein KIPB_001961 [Kipferlia bialata]|uniref:EamA domain-containing protein n=1 Tax=Kipferlia bialata TaxID=797122 RepID=A0A391NJ15_9EUKA|nr:hypothetical protein KIPB_001961 [Kipferlia bialata]|eukprot:g1961.t1